MIMEIRIDKKDIKIHGNKLVENFWRLCAWCIVDLSKKDFQNVLDNLSLFMRWLKDEMSDLSDSFVDDDDVEDEEQKDKQRIIDSLKKKYFMDRK